MKDIILKVINDIPNVTFFDLTKILGLDLKILLSTLGFNEFGYYKERLLHWDGYDYEEIIVIYDNKFKQRLYYQNNIGDTEYMVYDEDYNFLIAKINVNIKDFLKNYDKLKLRRNKATA